MAYTYSKIASVTVGSGGASSIDFLAIPQNYTDLVINYSIRGGNASVVDGIFLRFNSDLTTGNYSNRRIYGSGASAVSDTSTAPMFYNGSSSTSNTFTNASIYIPNYVGSTYKSWSGDAAHENNATTAYVTFVAGLWNNSSAINSIKMIPENNTFSQYSTATLYGIKAEV